METSQGPLVAGFVVDASGFRHWLARHLGLQVEARSPRLIARYGYAGGACPGREEAPALVTHDTGWTWTARVGPDRYAWTRLELGSTDKIPLDWRPEEFHGLQLHGKTRSGDVTWRWATAGAGPGFFLVGDAASVLDPASSHGVLKAIMSGMMAAQTIGRITSHESDECQATRSYSQWIGDWFDHDKRRLRELYTVFTAWDNANLGTGMR